MADLVHGGAATAMQRGLATAVSLLAWWACLFVLYLMLISSVTAAELVLGAGGALLGAVAAEALRRVEEPRVGGVRALLGAVAAFPLTLLREIGTLTAAVVRELRGAGDSGRIVRLGLEPGASAALTAALLSASPGACVIDIRDLGPGQEPRGGTELTLHVLGPEISRVERALPGRRLS
ncbi:Na+/H+ antiporter subunit E [Actinacidiphila acidipaludis]|uniref:Na+/H+ antiporter subunit E n=1 Tax=Actinacidiphila acidipaludis TaxID=2873382 RepID=A0ABS7QLJ1_9ACTN|nr:Na+/H+ antiporter subunit E [Streptomyces acidipaludis]MBY8882752.1 Na+/H+ antiporter subunit E [Streptomyces acidipaludis]